jgi:hypothetical protein
MWSQIVGTLIVLVIATYAIQLFLPRGRGSTRRASARWDIAPVIGFLGILLLALSFAEAWRRGGIEVWLAGIVVGLVLGALLWIALGSRSNIPTRPSGSALIATIRLIRTFGLPVLVTIVGVYFVVRIVGAMAEVFVSGLLGAAMVAMAVWIFLVSWQTTKTS